MVTASIRQPRGVGRASTGASAAASGVAVIAALLLGAFYFLLPIAWVLISATNRPAT